MAGSGVEDARDYLLKEKVFEHLGKIIDRVVVEKPQDAHGLVEVLSRLVKESSAKSEAETAPAEAEMPKSTNPDASLTKIQLFDEAPPPDEAIECELTDFMSDADILSWAGVGFGEQESYLIMCSLRRLAMAEKAAGGGIKSLRFWGKLLGTQQDYYVVEAGRDAGGDAGDPRIEPPGDEGVNKYLYFVTTDLYEPTWTKLPDVRPWHIMASMQVKKLVTGDLSADVITHPVFPEDSVDGAPGKPAKEIYLVRALIARITADTIICLKGFVEVDDSAPGPPQPNDNFVYPSTAQLVKLDSWIHYRHYLLRTVGRTKHLDDDLAADPADADDPPQKPVVKEAVPDEIRPLVGDGLNWMIKQFGDTTNFSNPYDKDSLPRSDVVTCLRCLSWPGSVTCVKSGIANPMHQMVSIYVGYGLAAEEPDFFFRAPLDMCEEDELPEEEIEPQGVQEDSADPDLDDS